MPEDREIVSIVASDLRYIGEEGVRLADEDALRRCSVRLRELINADLLGRAWRVLGFEKQPIIVAPKLSLLVETANLTAFASGVALEGMRIGHFEVRQGPLARWGKDAAVTQNIANHPFPLNEYRDSCCIILSGQKVSRRQLISFVANKLGGAHFDPSRGEGRPKDRVAFQALDDARRYTFGPEVDGKGGRQSVYSELLAMAQHIEASPDIRRFLERANEWLAE